MGGNRHHRVGVLVVSLIAAFGFARYLSAPINRLAQAAQQVSELSLGGVQRLPTSLFTEMTEAASAFNSMVVGLRWFETYVPRKLVHQLVRQGADAVQTSVTREVTVMFTDIEGFTAERICGVAARAPDKWAPTAASSVVSMAPRSICWPR